MVTAQYMQSLSCSVSQNGFCKHFETDNTPWGVRGSVRRADVQTAGGGARSL